MFIDFLECIQWFHRWIFTIDLDLQCWSNWNLQMIVVVCCRMCNHTKDSMSPWWGVSTHYSSPNTTCTAMSLSVPGASTLKLHTRSFLRAHEDATYKTWFGKKKQETIPNKGGKAIWSPTFNMFNVTKFTTQSSSLYEKLYRLHQPLQDFFARIWDSKMPLSENKSLCNAFLFSLRQWMVREWIQSSRLKISEKKNIPCSILFHNRYYLIQSNLRLFHGKLFHSSWKKILNWTTLQPYETFPFVIRNSNKIRYQERRIKYKQ